MSKDDVVKKSAELLRQGATMLSLTCPICGSPLFKLKNGDIVCPIHGKVIIARDEREVKEKLSVNIYDSIIEIAYKRLKELSKKIIDSEDMENESKIADLLYKWMNIIEKAKRLKEEQSKQI
ncbi:hypothetical protein IOK49_06010 [Fervidicoccus fontis]|jgi:UPF0148 protein|uniref:Sjogrens syndrome scleroderma autoantigen 1 n=2 Tax=Fervidicoccus fontis TaxID=683846 RepID=I0A1H5_FERFK|nr:Sjogren's syndrome/scleroderma autoantigen 1 family protein [Fervidicoccus fontis]AFH42832.1 hypothetical protein FFONT_0844 [Fervidicoccus fontis Kam940]MBE9391618.1 hypothetical protein [Fervidicoccus fontis]